MKYSIFNSNLEVSVLSSGAEITSIKSKKLGNEYMWNGDSNVWGSQAPVLFPIIGSLKNGECTIDENTYKIPKHGFIRNNENLQLKSKTDAELVFQLNYSEETLSMFPYKFSFTISFKLTNNSLRVSHKIINLDNTAIHFALGGHPAFKCPVNENENYNDYYLEFSENENSSTTLLSPNGLLSDKKEKVLNNTNILKLNGDLFNNDALILKDLVSRQVSLKSKKSKQVLTVSYHDFPYLGLWAKPQAPFICIEPWIGTADHENTDGDYLKKDSLVCLPKNKTFSAEYIITIDE